MRVCVYVRMSTSRQEASPDQQRKAIKALCDREGHEIACEYSDLGVSGVKTLKRTGFLKMIAAAEAGEFERIVVFDRSRFGRFDSYEAASFIQRLRDAGVTLESVAEGVAAWEDFGGRVIDAVTQEAKAAYSRDVSRATLRGQAAKILEGRGYPGGVAPYGYARKTKIEGTHRISELVIEPAAAAVVRLVFREFLKPGGTITNVARQLNQQGVPTAGRGREWGKTAMSRLLRNPVYCGDLVWAARSTGLFHSLNASGDVVPRKAKGNQPGAPIVRRDAVPAIIKREDWERAQEKLKQRSKIKARPTAQNPLAGLVTCGICGQSLHTAEAGNMRCGGSRAAAAQPCSSARVPVQSLLAGVIEVLEQRFLTPAAQRRIKKTLQAIVAGQRAAAASEDRTALEARIASLEADLERGAFRLAEVDESLLKPLQRALERKADELKHAQRELAALKTPKAATAVIDEAMANLKQLGKAVKRADALKVNGLLRALSVRVVVGPAENGSRAVTVTLGGGIGALGTTSQRLQLSLQLCSPAEKSAA
jgi:site-specific DNA recombinase